MLRPHRAPAPFAILTLATLSLAALSSAQQKAQLSLATVFERGAGLAPNLPQVLWLPGGHEATVVVTADDGRQTLHRVVDGRFEAAPLADGSDVALALQLAPSEQPRPLPPMSWLDRDTLRLEHEHAIYHWQLGTDEADRVLAWPEPDDDPSGREPMHAIAPGDGHVAVRKDHQLWLQPRAGGLRQLTFDGSDDIVYGGAAHRAEFGITTGMFWSADGRYLAFYREDQRPIAPYPYQDLSTLAPAPRAGRYPMAGRPHAKVTVGVCDTRDYGVTWLAADPDADLYWTNVTFAPDGGICVVLVDRGQSHLQLVRFDLATGERTATLLHEHDAEWIEPEHGPTFFEDGSFLWWSRRSGHRQLWHHASNGTLLGAVTSGDHDVQNLLAVSADERTVWFQAAGADPRQLHLFAVDPGVHGDGARGATRQITQERGHHEVTLAPDGEAAAIVWSNLETPPEARLVDTGDGSVTPLPQPADPLAAFALPEQRFFEVATDDGTTLYGHVAVPPDLQPGERCPVLLYVYGGPHVQLVTDSWLGGASIWLQALAAEGFVVCRLDNRGTPNRGEQFEQTVHRRLGTLEVEDQLRAVAWLERQPFVDAARIGVHGWSYGGYMTLRLMLLAPETFACGVSGAPVTDWAMYETGYGERYMDMPQENQDGYLASSCLPLAGNLKRPLLVVHGTDDRTVMWSHTLDFVARCIDAGVDLDYLPYPMQLHGLRGKHRMHFLLKLRAYLVRHLRPQDRGAGAR